ncbi:MAG TPA: TetR/AcrR family transcriptional regulator C-terminal domain-containing protein [Acidimicrobiales bacterium]|nr:TetR/AcrR family transcriptional regulator C-terminal domain-containing protein [Acidimicrobiales bacterium]
MVRRTPLTRDRVLRAALDLVDREGLDALTMRRLGRELGVEAMSLYGYVQNKQDLIEGVVEQIFRQMPLIVPGPGPWSDRIRRHAATYRAVLLDHPNAVRLVAGRPLITEGTAAFVDSALAELQSMGFDLAMADRVLGVIASFTLGLVAEQVGDAIRADSTYTPVSAAIDVDRFPNVAAVGEMKPVDYDLEFELGLDFIVAGIERLLAADAG